MKKSKKIIFIIVLVCLFFTEASIIVAEAAYFVKGKFKDVFVNRQDYFTADRLYSIASIDSTKKSVASNISKQSISVYNHDVSTGEYNSFDVTFDVYVWLESSLPDGNAYTFIYYENEVEQSVSITSTAHASPVVTARLLEGGKCSAETFAISFGYNNADDLSGVPALNVVAVATSPERLSGAVIGAAFVPAKSETCSVTGSFDRASSLDSLDSYAAFTYSVQSVGSTVSEGDVVIKWNGNALTLITVDQSLSFTSAVKDISEGIFTKQYSWTAQNNKTDTFAFFRNNEGGYWDGEVTWTDIQGLVSVEYVKGVA